MATRPEVASQWIAHELETDAVLCTLACQNQHLELLVSNRNVAARELPE